MKQYDYITFILRASPFHDGHLQVLRQAQSLAENVIVLVGSSNRPRTIRNPWTFQERCLMILNAFPKEEWLNLHIVPLNDYYYDEGAWVNEIWNKVSQIIRTCELQREGTRSRRIDELKLGLIGYKKDKTSGYLSMFEEMEAIPVSPVSSNDKLIDGTSIRADIFEYGHAFDISVLPHSTVDVLMNFIYTPEFTELVEEYKCIKRGKEEWARAPYTPIFMAGDAVVFFENWDTNSIHVLTITRGRRPGKNLMAIPGGFLDPDEFLSDTAFRELHEETKLQVDSCELRLNVVETKIFDHPLRSLRGRMITQAVCIYIKGYQCPEITAADDAAAAHWTPLEDINSMNMFDDHWDVIRYFANQHLKK